MGSDHGSTRYIATSRIKCVAGQMPHLKQHRCTSSKGLSNTLTVIPRSRSTWSLSRYCVFEPFLIAPVNSSNLSARVLLPWSICATMLKFRMRSSGKLAGSCVPVLKAFGLRTVTSGLGATCANGLKCSKLVSWRGLCA